MPVDDTELATLLQSAYDKLTVITTERSKLKAFINAATTITKVPTQSDPEIMELPNDRMLGVKYSPTRRQAIYDKLLSDKPMLGL